MENSSERASLGCMHAFQPSIPKCVIRHFMNFTGANYFVCRYDATIEIQRTLSNAIHMRKYIFIFFFLGSWQFKFNEIQRFRWSRRRTYFTSLSAIVLEKRNPLLLCVCFFHRATKMKCSKLISCRKTVLAARQKRWRASAGALQFKSQLLDEKWIEVEWI